MFIYKRIRYPFCIFLLSIISHLTEGQQISIFPISKLSTSLERITSMGFSSKGDRLILGDKKGKLQLWDNNTLQLIAEAEKKDEIISTTFDRDDNVLAIDKDGNVSVFDGENMMEKEKWSFHDKITDVAIDPEKQFISYITKGDILKIYSLSANMQQAAIDFSARISKKVLYLEYDRFGQQLGILTADGTALIIDPVVQNVIKEVKLRSDEFHGAESVIHAAASDKGSELFVTGVQEVFIPKGGIKNGQPERRNSILAFDWDTSEQSKRIRLNNRVDAIEIGPGPSHIAYFTDNKFDISLVDLEHGEEVGKVTLEEFPRCMKISQDDAYLAVGDKNGDVYLYSLQKNATASIRITKPGLNRGYGYSVVDKSDITIEGILSDDSKIKSVTINNTPAKVANDGSFSADVLLIPGKNKVRVVAEDYQSKVIYKDVYVSRTPETGSVLAEDKSTNHGQERVALVIGNATYSGVGELFNTLNDVDLMSQTLKELGFEVTTLKNGNYEAMKNAIYTYGYQIQDVDVSVFFYAGHGLEIDGVNYLVPIDAELNSILDVKQKTVPITGLLNTVEYANDEGLNMIILDACRNNPFPTGRRGGVGLAKSTPPSGTIIAYSTSPGSVASDGEGDHGLYTKELARQMQISQRIEDVFMRTRIGVEEISHGEQKPWEESRLRGIFYLKF